MQITAELDNQHLEKLQILEKTLKKNTSELIAFIIDELYKEHEENKITPCQHS